MTNPLPTDAEKADYGDHKSGYLMVADAADAVRLRRHWPFDFAEDEWIDIENADEIPRYRRAVNDALTGGWGSSCGTASGFLRITTRGQGLRWNSLAFKRLVS